MGTSATTPQPGASRHADWPLLAGLALSVLAHIGAFAIWSASAKASPGGASADAAQAELRQPQDPLMPKVTLGDPDSAILSLNWLAAPTPKRSAAPDPSEFEQAQLERNRPRGVRMGTGNADRDSNAAAASATNAAASGQAAASSRVSIPQAFQSSAQSAEQLPAPLVTLDSPFPLGTPDGAAETGLFQTHELGLELIAQIRAAPDDLLPPFAQIGADEDLFGGFYPLARDAPPGSSAPKGEPVASVAPRDGELNPVPAPVPAPAQEPATDAAPPTPSHTQQAQQQAQGSESHVDGASPSAQAVPAIARAGAENTQGLDSDRDAPLATRVRARDVEQGSPVSAEGLRVFTKRPRLSKYTRLTATSNGDLVVQIDFDPAGSVFRVTQLESSGNPSLDETFITTIYEWTAQGPPLDEMRENCPACTISVDMRIVF